MSHTRNTNKIEELHEAWARENGYRRRAPRGPNGELPRNYRSLKRQAASTKRQAPSTHSIKPQALRVQKSQAN